MARPLLESGVSQYMIDVIDPYQGSNEARLYRGVAAVKPEFVPHNVPNCAWRIFTYDGQRKEHLFYCTDTSTLDGVEARGYDWFFIEANRTEAEYEAAIAAKQAAGRFAYEVTARRNHLSREQAEAWLARNMGPNSRYVFLHQHRDT